MQTEKQIADRARELTTLCLANSIQNALSVQLGADWFRYFKQEECSSSNSNPIIKQSQNSIFELDFQALLKMLRFRMSYRIYVLDFYYPGKSREYDKGSPFDNLLFRLINFYRNQIDAHQKARDISEYDTVHMTNPFAYGYMEAIQDMKQLTRIFRSVQDKRGVSYFDRVSELEEEYKLLKNMTFIPVEDVLSRELPDVSYEEAVTAACEAGIRMENFQNHLSVVSGNYPETIQLLQRVLRQRDAEGRVIGKPKSKVPVAIWILLGVLAGLVIGLLLGILLF